MKIKRILSLLISAAILCSVLASCGKSKNVSNFSDNAIIAASADAFLAIQDGSFWIQYFGDNNDPEHTMLSHGAGIAHITGNGNYTVSVTADTDGFRYDVSKDVTDHSVVPKGIQFLAVIIRDGQTLFPDAVITVDSIKVDGRTINMTSKPYTSYDTEKELRANIYNQWVGDIPSKTARTTEGRLYNEAGVLNDFAANYSPVVVDVNDFATWMTIEVNFTVSGIQ